MYQTMICLMLRFISRQLTNITCNNSFDSSRHRPSTRAAEYQQDNSVVSQYIMQRKYTQIHFSRRNLLQMIQIIPHFPLSISAAPVFPSVPSYCHSTCARVHQSYNHHPQHFVSSWTVKKLQQVIELCSITKHKTLLEQQPKRNGINSIEHNWTRQLFTTTLNSDSKRSARHNKT